jgi:hypothetical protein
MNSILSGLAGAAILAASFGVFVLARKIGNGAKQLTAAFGGIPKLVASNLEVASALNRFSGELEFLRTAMLGGTPEDNAQGPTAASQAPRRPQGGPIPQFPTWQPFVAAVDVPDAEESDTEIVDTSDEDLVQIEQIEEIRGKGFAAGPEADPMENPPGVTANV